MPERTLDFGCTGGSLTEEYTIEFPKNVKIVALPKDVHLPGGTERYDATYRQDNSAFPGLPWAHRIDMAQKSVAGYWQQTIGLLPTTDFSYGGPLTELAMTGVIALKMPGTKLRYMW